MTAFGILDGDEPQAIVIDDQRCAHVAARFHGRDGRELAVALRDRARRDGVVAVDGARIVDGSNGVSLATCKSADAARLIAETVATVIPLAAARERAKSQR